VTGTSVSGYEAGEVWHLLDQRFQMPVTLVDGGRLGGTKLIDYTVLVMVSGNYSSVPASAIEQLKQFVKEGGTLVAIGSAIRWLHGNEILSVAFREQVTDKDDEEVASVERRPYAEAGRDAALRLVRGSIVATNVDHTHPIGYGIPESRTLPVFRNNTVFLDVSQNAYSTPVIHDQQPLLSGYISAENLELLTGSASVVVHASGKGRIVLMAENPNFRAFWYGTNRLFLNALFFGPIIRVP
jgi:hypothetical protein